MYMDAFCCNSSLSSRVQWTRTVVDGFQMGGANCFQRAAPWLRSGSVRAAFCLTDFSLIVGCVTFGRILQTAVLHADLPVAL